MKIYCKDISTLAAEEDRNNLAIQKNKFYQTLGEGLAVLVALYVVLSILAAIWGAHGG